MFERERLYIGGQWVESSKDDWIEVIAPSTEQVVGRARAASAADADTAVSAARAALNGEWTALGLPERMEVINQAADFLEENGRTITELLAWEMGSPVGSGSGYLQSPLTRMRKSFPAAASQVVTCELRRDEEGAAVLQQSPVGVVVAITPWNTAFGGVILKTIPALLAGCPVILKPSPLTPLDPFWLADAFESAGLPAGMFNVLPGGAEVGEALVTHTGVEMVTFTGSSTVGARIAALAALTMKRVVLECGGKSAAIVLEDADLEATTRVISGAAFALSGQYCRALSRVLVPLSRYDEVVGSLAGAAQDLRVGDPFEEGTRLGPLVSDSQRARTESFIALGIKEGAKLVTGGGRPGHLPTGYYMEPTVFSDVSNEMRIAQEEIFGPVVGVLPYDDVSDAIAIANDSSYGLSGAVFTTDPIAGLEIASRIETGLIGINTQGARECVPCGGVKLSGMGDEHGPEGYREFLQSRSVIVPAHVADQLEADGMPTTWINR